MEDKITIRGAKLHNLKNVTVSIPKNKFVVFTGVSGSGKSTLAFDTLHKEGQRQYMESLGMVTYESRPPVDEIVGLSPSISIDQHLTNRSPRSTVGTATEVYTYLRVLFARVGHRPCPHCGRDIPPSQEVLDSAVMDDDAAPIENGEDGEMIACPHCGGAVPEMGMASFSFNKPAGACPTCTGLGVVFRPNLEQLIDESRSILDGAVTIWDAFYAERGAATLHAAGAYYGFEFDPALPVRDYSPTARDLLLYGVEGEPFRSRFPDKEPPATVRAGRFEGLVTNLIRRHAEHAADEEYRQKIERFLSLQTCPDCAGTRLRPEARAVTVAGDTIVTVSRLSLGELAGWLERLPAALSEEDCLVAGPILDDLRERVRRLVEVGLEYLTLDRASPSLSAGEAQRLRMASLLGSGLTGVLYVLDEPTIGLHARDTTRLVRMLRALRDLGNTVLVIEHDMEMIAAADVVVDFGPGAGRQGGQIVAQGSPAEVAACPGSLTGRYLSGAAAIPVPAKRRLADGPALVIHGAREHNLKNITVRLPLGVLTAVSGVSGSGKSSLMFDILDRAARAHYYGAGEQPGAHDRIEGWDLLDKVITIDQEPIGRSTRSNAATYTDAFTGIREAFASTAEARERGLTARHFSFNTPGGRCDRCEGAGVLSVEMHFLPDVTVRCPACKGRRYKREVLAVKYRGYDIAQVLDLTIAEALPLFVDIPSVQSRLGLMAEVGLGYLQLGQPASTFSGGEAQRVKLARELSRRGNGRTLYLLDEPSTGLHPADVANLLLLLQRLVDAGSTVVVIEHNLDIIKSADWVIDLGPEGGDAGGWVVAEGAPEQVARAEGSQTGALLRRVL